MPITPISSAISMFSLEASLGYQTSSFLRTLLALREYNMHLLLWPRFISFSSLSVALDFQLSQHLYHIDLGLLGFSLRAYV